MIAPGATIGIIGGGQLGRMSALAAAELGYRVHIFTPEADAPASQVCAATTQAAYDDREALEAFAHAVDVVTFEFENIPHESIALLSALVPVHPGAEVLRVSRNRLREKDFVRSLGIGTAPYAKVESPEELQTAIAAIGVPSILKTTEMGYDGKGQAKILNAADAPEAWQSLTIHDPRLTTHELILEGFVDFTMEISVIVARGAGGEYKLYPPVQNIHKNHILDETHAPAPVADAVAREAERIAVKIAEGLDLQGLLAVEMFVTKKGGVLVNELAPRPHNSGHWTMDACVTSQFEQHIRAVCGLPLGDTSMLCKAVMKNLIGDEVDGWERILREPNAKLHLYGKKEARPGRKMGHVNRLKNE
jgi:5-(carboxyamino)imidazole ribonucleotide synthase